MTESRRLHATARAARPRLFLPVCLAAALLVGALLSLVGGPHGRPTSGGDLRGPRPGAATCASVAGLTDGGYQTLSVVPVQDGQVSYAGLGPLPDGAARPRRPRTSWARSPRRSPALLLADGVQRGELRLDDPVSALPDRAARHPGRATPRWRSWPPTPPGCRPSRTRMTPGVSAAHRSATRTPTTARPRRCSRPTRTTKVTDARHLPLLQPRHVAARPRRGAGGRRRRLAHPGHRAAADPLGMTSDALRPTAQPTCPADAARPAQRERLAQRPTGTARPSPRPARRPGPPRRT